MIALVLVCLFFTVFSYGAIFGTNRWFYALCTAIAVLALVAAVYS